LTTTVTCTIPDVASNGRWGVSIQLQDGVGAGGRPLSVFAHAELEVVGGSDDREPPVLESYEFGPAPIHPDSEFEATLRFRDESLPIISTNSLNPVFQFSEDWNTVYRCIQDGSTVLEPDLFEAHFRCLPIGEPSAGVFETKHSFRDALGHYGSAMLTLEVVEGP
jgi:hypothetical protein